LSDRLPNGDRAILDIRKIEDYCLSPDHPERRHKARVFRDALGMGRSHARVIADEFLAAARGPRRRRPGPTVGVRVGQSTLRYYDKTSALW